MSCYGAHRPTYCVIAWDTRLINEPGYLPLVVGPFKTKTQAKKAGALDFADDPNKVYGIRQLVTFHDAKDRLITLHFDQFLDPTRRKKASDG